ncbi:MAG: hypothetical protein WBD20_18260 [Pirellulaceae bacterium]
MSFASVVFFVASISKRRQQLPDFCGVHAGSVRNGVVISAWTLSDTNDSWRPVAIILHKKKATKTDTHPVPKPASAEANWDDSRDGWRVDVEGDELRFAPAFVTIILIVKNQPSKVIRVPIERFIHSSGAYIGYEKNTTIWEIACEYEDR